MIVEAATPPPAGTVHRAHLRDADAEGDELELVPVLSVRASVSEHDADSFVAGALEEIRAFMHAHEIEPAGAPFTLKHSAEPPGTVDLEVGWPLERPAAGRGRIHGGSLPLASMSHCRSAPVRGHSGDDYRDPPRARSRPRRGTRALAPPTSFSKPHLLT